jgi:hypothetical protein
VEKVFRIIYFKHVSGNYYVTLHCISQTIVLLPGFFKKVMQLEGNIALGARDVDLETIIELGFVIPSFWTRKTAD